VSDPFAPEPTPEPTPGPAAPKPVPPGRRQAEAKRQAILEEDELERLDREIDEVEAFRMPLMEHLIELKDRLIKSVVATFLGGLIGLYFSADLYAILIAPFNDAASKSGLSVTPSLVTIGLYEGINVYFKIAFIGGISLASPVLTWQFWQFIAPGLYKTERRVVAPLWLSSLSLFIAGAVFCYYVIFPSAFPFFFSVIDANVTVSADDYLSSVMQMMIAFGACFQMPIGAYFAARLGFIDHKDMLAGFRWATVVIFIVAAILTPSPDMLSQVLLAMPMMLLYGVGIVVAYFSSTKVRTDGT
jgi:sec-independent protein translocase protein TatC